MRFLHASDIHLDSPLRGLRARAGEKGDEIANAPRTAFVKLIEFAIDQEVDLLLLAGDNWDGGHADYGSLLFFMGQMSRLGRAGVRVVMIQGNHDAENQLKIKGTDNLTILSSHKPKTVKFEDLGVAVHGQSYPQRDVQENLAATYPAPIAGFINIGLLHTAVAGYSGAHHSYAPCSVQDLRDRGYDYWALGHIHSRTQISDNPWIIYPGNLQARFLGEAGEKGATLVTIEDGRITEVAPVHLDVVRWMRISVDVSSCDSQDEIAVTLQRGLREAVNSAGGRMVAARIYLEGQTRMHQSLKLNANDWIAAEVERARLDIENLWIEQIVVETAQRPDGRASADSDAIVEIERAVVEILSSAQEKLYFTAQISEVATRLPPSLAEMTMRGPDDETLDEDAVLESVLSDAKDILLARIIGAA
jgi:DNA repair exonuclease SbcCD nuclease subunit